MLMGVGLYIAPTFLAVTQLRLKPDPRIEGHWHTVQHFYLTLVITKILL